MPDIDRRFGREAFGADAAGYDAIRPGYPDWVFERLRERCGLAAGAAVFEIGAGTGTATRRLLAEGANPLVAIEPDARLAAYLRTTAAHPALTVVEAPFEDAVLPRAGFDIGLSATAFHWLEEARALARIAALLRPGGAWAMVWNVFGDPERPDPFHEATFDLLNDGPRSPSEGGDRIPFALNVNARLSAFGRSGAFEAVTHKAKAWSLVLDPDQTVALYATFSDITARPPDEQRDILAELRRIALRDFAGRVTRNMITILYTARRRG